MFHVEMASPKTYRVRSAAAARRHASFCLFCACGETDLIGCLPDEWQLVAEPFRKGTMAQVAVSAGLFLALQG